MRVLFLALSSAGYGETTIGISVARRLEATGTECSFVIEEMSETLLAGTSFPFLVLNPAMGALAEVLVDEHIRSWRPDVLVLSDYFTYCGVFAKRFGIDPWFIDRYQLPVVPIDIWEWSHSDFWVDVFDGKKMAVSPHILDYPAALRPVPICHPDTSDAGAYPFRLRDGDERVARRTREHLREVFGVPRGGRMVMLALAKWQTPEYEDENGNRVARNVPEVLARCLQQLPANAHVVQVGEPMWALDLLAPDRWHHLPQCSPTRFNTLLGSMDLFVGLNVAATTMVRAVMAGVPGLVVTNSHLIHNPDQAREQLDSLAADPPPWLRAWVERTLPLYPFRMWPLGFHAFLEPLLAENAYTSAYREVDLLDVGGITAAVEQSLFDDTTISEARAAQSRYLDVLSATPSADEAFATLSTQLGLG